MVFKGSLYILNLLCGMIPCEYQHPYPDTSVSVAFRDKINVDDDSDQLELSSGGSEDGKNDLYKDIDYNRTHPLLVYTSTGKMRGYYMKAVGGRKIRAYEGIPFAEAPLGVNRFEVRSKVK
ncbi:unnamed protein product [Orchesella dallaii]|uniref:Carboxylesterase type B domain-containing protein n=1 Tax=Orchesella dallaii TaxID=48710 RepID=A0ABP1Q9S2_9HEXA